MPDVFALVILIVAASIAIAYAAIAVFGRGRYSPWERLLYAPVYALARVLWRVEICWRDGVDGRDSVAPNLSKQRLLGDRLAGGAILLANHRCSLDPFFIQLVSGRRVHWMVAADYFNNNWSGPLLRAYEAIPTKRAGIDTASTKRAITHARDGRFVGMFPEGRINRTAEPLLSIRPGAAIVAIRSGVPLVPIWIEGAPRGWEVYSALFIPAKVRVIVGPAERIPIKNEGPETTTSDELAGEPQTASQVHRDEAVEWIRSVMHRAMTLGGFGDSSVEMAGRQWLS